MNKTVIEKAHAKINLTLAVEGKRDDGYFNINSIMVPVELHDTLQITKSEGFEIVCDEFQIPITENLIYKSFSLMRDRYNLDSNIKVHLTKRIPHEAGLAGGSADCSATIRGVNRLFNLDLTYEEMKGIALELGSDTAFCLYQQPAIVSGRGENLEFIDSAYDGQVVIIKPPFGNSTKGVFSMFDHNDFGNVNNENVINALLSNDKNLLVNSWYNNLEDAAFSYNSKMESTIKSVRKICENSIMSGSGSTILLISDVDNKKLDLLQFGDVYITNIMKKDATD